MSDMREQQIEMLVKYFNLQTGMHYRFCTQVNRDAVGDAIERANGDRCVIVNGMPYTLDELAHNGTRVESVWF